MARLSLEISDHLKEYMEEVKAQSKGELTFKKQIEKLLQPGFEVFYGIKKTNKTLKKLKNTYGLSEKAIQRLIE